MGKQDRCCVGGCDNDNRYPEKMEKRSHVKELLLHKFTTVSWKRVEWIKLISKGRENFAPGTHGTFVCSNHFPDGKPTIENPHPTLYLKPSEHTLKSPVKKRRKLCYDSGIILDSEERVGEKEEEDHPVQTVHSTFFDDITREHDIRFYTGFINGEIFRTLFNHLSKKASCMNYWKGTKNTRNSNSSRFIRNSTLIESTDTDDALEYTKCKPGKNKLKIK